MKQLAVICWSFGLSYRKIEALLTAFGVSLSRMSGWRDVQAGAEGIRRRKQWKPAWENGQGVIVAFDHFHNFAYQFLGESWDNSD